MPHVSASYLRCPESAGIQSSAFDRPQLCVWEALPTHPGGGWMVIKKKLLSSLTSYQIHWLSMEDYGRCCLIIGHSKLTLLLF